MYFASPFARRAGRLAATLVVVVPLLAGANTQPFRSNVIDLPNRVHVRGKSKQLLKELYRDAQLAAIGPKMRLGWWLEQASLGRPIHARQFRRESLRAVKQVLPAGSTKEAQRDLQQKLEPIEMALSMKTLRAQPTTAIQGEEDARNHAVAKLLRPNHTQVRLLEEVPGARLILFRERATSEEFRRALERYGRQLVTSRKGRGSALLAALAHVEVGRAVLVGDEVMKGVGPTKWAGNRFNKVKKSGTFSIQEGIADWRRSMILKNAGIATYQPVALAMYPYLEWSDTDGWRAVGNYVRRPEEALRISDLDHLTKTAKQQLVKHLKEKIERALAEAGRSRKLSDIDVARFVIERLGRTAGLFHGGGFGGKYYFHGMLHEQNVSLMGEIVDVGGNVGILGARADLDAAWKESSYSRWKRTLRSWRSFSGTSEKDILRKVAHSMNDGLAEMGGALSRQDVDRRFDRAYEEGREGIHANDYRWTLREDRE